MSSPERLGDYELIREIGRGSHGAFHLARAPERLHLDHDYVALKVLDHQATDQEFRRVANELRLVASIGSEHLVEVYDAGYQSGALFYAMAYYPDGSLDDPKVPLDRDARLGVLADAARGAHDLHEAGVVHRDIRPGNILVDGRRGRLSDLGLAQVMAPGMTTTGRGPVGSIEYMEPDLIWGERGSRATDVWSLGLTAHQVLCGRSVYPDLPTGNLAAAFQHVLHGSPSIDPALAPDEIAVIERCCAPAREDRWATAAELADAFEQLRSAP